MRLTVGELMEKLSQFEKDKEVFLTKDERSTWEVIRIGHYYFGSTIEIYEKETENENQY